MSKIEPGCLCVLKKSYDGNEGAICEVLSYAGIAPIRINEDDCYEPGDGPCWLVKFISPTKVSYKQDDHVWIEESPAGAVSVIPETHLRRIDDGGLTQPAVTMTANEVAA